MDVSGICIALWVWWVHIHVSAFVCIQSLKFFGKNVKLEYPELSNINIVSGNRFDKVVPLYMMPDLHSLS